VAAKAKPAKPPSVVAETRETVEAILGVWALESLDARERDDLDRRFLAQRVCDLALDLRAVLSEAT
jgi:hypothetical protein